MRAAATNKRGAPATSPAASFELAQNGVAETAGFYKLRQGRKDRNARETGTSEAPDPGSLHRFAAHGVLHQARTCESDRTHV